MCGVRGWLQSDEIQQTPDYSNRQKTAALWSTPLTEPPHEKNTFTVRHVGSEDRAAETPPTSLKSWTQNSLTSVLTGDQGWIQLHKTELLPSNVSLLSSEWGTAETNPNLSFLWDSYSIVLLFWKTNPNLSFLLVILLCFYFEKQTSTSASSEIVILLCFYFEKHFNLSFLFRDHSTGLLFWKTNLNVSFLFRDHATGLLFWKTNLNLTTGRPRLDTTCWPLSGANSQSSENSTLRFYFETLRGHCTLVNHRKSCMRELL